MSIGKDDDDDHHCDHDQDQIIIVTIIVMTMIMVIHIMVIHIITMHIMVIPDGYATLAQTQPKP